MELEIVRLSLLVTPRFVLEMVVGRKLTKM